MIKITSKLYVHFLTLLMFIICIFNGKFKIFVFSYLVMALHEAAHLLAATCIGLKTDKIVFYPYGVNLKLKNRIIYSLADEIILYLSGPLVNCVFALVSAFFYNIYHLPRWQVMYAANIMLFVTNMIPVYPLDGGVILKKLIAYRLGTDTANKVMRIISTVITAVLIGLSLYFIYMTEFNFTVILLDVFLFSSIFTQEEKYDVDFIKNLMFSNKKSKIKVSHIIAHEKDTYIDIAKKFNPREYSVVYFENTNGSITKIMTENEIIKAISQ